MYRVSMIFKYFLIKAPFILSPLVRLLVLRKYERTYSGFIKIVHIYEWKVLEKQRIKFCDYRKAAGGLNRSLLRPTRYLEAHINKYHKRFFPSTEFANIEHMALGLDAASEG